MHTESATSSQLEELVSSFPGLQKIRALEAFALRAKSKLALDLLAFFASEGEHSNAEAYIQNFSSRGTSNRATASLARAFGILHGDADAFDKSIYMLLQLHQANPDSLTREQFIYLCSGLFDCGHQLEDVNSKALRQLPRQRRLSFELENAVKKAEEIWFTKFKETIGVGADALLPLAPGPDAFNKLASAIAPGTITDGPLVSVIMTSFKPNSDVELAVDSILAQTWQNFELIIVDDGSGAEFENSIKKIAAKDGRIRIVRLTKNAGTYQARNAGLLHANGKYITGQDSDDWSHPQRLEKQVLDLEANPLKVANACAGLRFKDNMSVDLAKGRNPFRVQKQSVPVSMMIRMSPVHLKLGFYDAVRKGADSEFISRISAVFGGESYGEIADILYFIRVSSTSLSGGDFAPGWRHENRAVYLEAYKNWHKSLGTIRGDAFVDVLSQRKFPAPIPYRADLPRNAPREFDVVFSANWFASGSLERELLPAILEAVADGLRVGFSQLHSLNIFQNATAAVSKEILALLSDGKIEYVSQDEASVFIQKLVVSADTIAFNEINVHGWSVSDLICLTSGKTPGWLLDKGLLKSVSSFGANKHQVMKLSELRIDV